MGNSSCKLSGVPSGNTVDRSTPTHMTPSGGMVTMTGGDWWSGEGEGGKGEGEGEDDDDPFPYNELTDPEPDPNVDESDSADSYDEQDLSEGNYDTDIGSGDNSTTPTPESVAPDATKIFRNSNMTIENWERVEKMIDKIKEDCLGEALYNGLVAKLDGKTLTIQFGTANQFFYNNATGGIMIRDAESNILLHEMWHAYQAYQETASSMNAAKLNREIEARHAQYLYISSLPEYSGSKWEKSWTTNIIHTSIVDLSDCINSHGELKSGATELVLETYMLNGPAALLQKTKTYSSYPYDYNQTGTANFKNVQKLSKDCK